MKKTVFNAEALVKVEIKDKRPCHYFSYQPYKKHWLWGIQKEGFYFTAMQFYTPDYLRNQGIEGIKFIVEGDMVYYSPEVTLSFAGAIRKSKTFETYDQAYTWGMEQANKGIDVMIDLP